MPDSSGPHINAAFLCERVLTEQDGVTSAIRIVDRVFMLTNEDDEPIDPNLVYTVYVNMKSGTARGSHTVKLQIEKPSGEIAPLLETQVLFEGEGRGVNLVVGMPFQPDVGPGLYWIDVLLGDDRLTRMPLEVVYQRPPTVGAGGPGPLPGP